MSSGARVMVNPDSRVRHREAEEDGVRDDDRGRLLARHRLRTVLTCYGPLNLIRVLPQIAILTILTVFSSLLTGHPGRAKDAIGAWSWNFAHYGEIRRRSRYLERIRLVPDNEVRRLQTRGSAQVRAVMRRPASDERFAAAAAVGRTVAGSLMPGPRRTALLAWVVAIAFLLFGSRELITQGVPAIGQLAPLPSSATDLMRSFGAGWRSIGLGTTAAAPTAFALVGLGAIPVFGQTGLLHTLLALLPLLIGLIGIWRLTATDRRGAGPHRVARRVRGHPAAVQRAQQRALGRPRRVCRDALGGRARWRGRAGSLRSLGPNARRGSQRCWASASSSPSRSPSSPSSSSSS